MVPTCFILSWNRPIYLWLTLESLLRNTSMDLNFVLVDNASTDPQVRQVIRAFEKRNMFSDVHLCSSNDPNRISKTLNDYKSRLGDFFFFVESDVQVPENPCWASTYHELYLTHSRVGMVGSLCDPSDYIDEAEIRRAEPGLSPEEIEYYSYGGTRSKERGAHLDPTRNATVGDFPNPPGRLMLLDTEAVERCGYQPDHEMAKAMVKAGYNWYITTAFKHRHLSLMSFYDYPLHDDGTGTDYRKARFRFFADSGGLPYVGQLRKGLALRTRLRRLLR